MGGNRASPACSACLSGTESKLQAGAAVDEERAVWVQNEYEILAKGVCNDHVCSAGINSNGQCMEAANDSPGGHHQQRESTTSLAGEGCDVYKEDAGAGQDKWSERGREKLQVEVLVRAFPSTGRTHQVEVGARTHKFCLAVCAVERLVVGIHRTNLPYTPSCYTVWIGAVVPYEI